MSVFLAATGLIIIFSASAFGWGRLATKALSFETSSPSIIFNISFGLTLWVFVGGFLNALGLADATALNIIFILGIIFFAGTLFLWLREGGNQFQSTALSLFLHDKFSAGNKLLESIPVLLVIASSSYFIVTLLPADVFNHHDDLYTYLPRLFRMVQTGQLSDPLSLDYLGTDSLGAHSFLQSFVINSTSLRYVNGFDAVYCFLLGGLLLNDIGRSSGQHWLLRTVAIGAYAVINPQYVNISALYSGSLMILTLIYASLSLGSRLEKDEVKDLLGGAVVLALIVSTLMALKHTFIPFALSYCFLLFLLFFFFFPSRKRVFYLAGTSAVLSTVILAPWLISVHDKVVFFLSLVSRRANVLAETVNPASEQVQAASPSSLDRLFSSERLFYGGHAVDYNFIVLCLLAASLWCGFLLVKGKREASERGRMAVGASLGISVFIAFIISVNFTNFDAGIRYACPVIIATFPALSLLLAGVNGAGQTGSAGRCKTRTSHFAPLIILGICIGLFATNWYGRMVQLYEFRSMLSYPFSENYIKYNQSILSEGERETVALIQKEAVERAGILAWFDAVFHLDFKRNKIFAIAKPAYIANISSLAIKDLADEEKLQEYLQNSGIRYVLWAYNGVEKQRNAGTLELEQGLLALSKISRVVYNDGQRAMIDISGL